MRPLIGRITTIESERSRPTPAVPLVDDVLSACSHRHHGTESAPMPSTPVEAVVKSSRSEDRPRTGKQGSSRVER